MEPVTMAPLRNPCCILGGPISRKPAQTSNEKPPQQADVAGVLELVGCVGFEPTTR